MTIQRWAGAALLLLSATLFIILFANVHRSLGFWILAVANSFIGYVGARLFLQTAR
jgi:hypothetical protein